MKTNILITLCLIAVVAHVVDQRDQAIARAQNDERDIGSLLSLLNGRDAIAEHHKGRVIYTTFRAHKRVLRSTIVAESK